METTNVWVLNDRVSDFIMIFKERHFAKKCFANRIRLYKKAGFKSELAIKTERTIEIYLNSKNKIGVIELKKENIY